MHQLDLPEGHSGHSGVAMINEQVHSLDELEKIWNDFKSSDDTYDCEKVWSLPYPSTTRLTALLVWHLYYPWWDGFTICPIEVIREPEKFSYHYNRIQEASTQYPIDLMYNGRQGKQCKLLILDGMHRLAKLYINKIEVVEVRIIPRREIPNIRYD